MTTTETNAIDPTTVIHVMDNHTGAIVATSTYANIKRMRTKTEKLNQSYGACRYTVTFERKR